MLGCLIWGCVISCLLCPLAPEGSAGFWLKQQVRVEMLVSDVLVGQHTRVSDSVRVLRPKSASYAVGKDTTEFLFGECGCCSLHGGISSQALISQSVCLLNTCVTVSPGFIVIPHHLAICVSFDTHIRWSTAALALACIRQVGGPECYNSLLCVGSAMAGSDPLVLFRGIELSHLCFEHVELRGHVDALLMGAIFNVGSHKFEAADMVAIHSMSCAISSFLLCSCGFGCIQPSAASSVSPSLGLPWPLELALSLLSFLPRLIPSPLFLLQRPNLIVQPLRGPFVANVASVAQLVGLLVLSATTAVTM